MNRLAEETSPYLRQHADNPVDWYPWGDEALAKAASEDKPIFLSIGYASCHWCHVMAHESFEDTAAAEDLRRSFVAVKVDREERPDLDAIYMTAVQALTGSGGWPMSVFCTPDGRPFFAGTYFPPTDRHGMPAFRAVIAAVAEAWAERRDEVEQQAEALVDAVRKEARLADELALRVDTDGPDFAVLLERLVGTLSARFDDEWGGFGGAPKFPRPTFVDLCLRHHRRTGSARSLTMATVTLDAMAAGGIYDHVEGGFARYSTDRRWLVPHFEKMLTDQALLARAYLHAWQVTGEPAYRQVLTETLDYVSGRLSSPAGGLYSSEDADAAGVEGGHATFTLAQLRAVCEAAGRAELAEPLAEWYGVTERGNWEGTNVLHRPLGAPLARPEAVEEGRRLLEAERRRRPRPGLDDKVLTEWSAMGAAALAEAAGATGEARWARRAEQAADFLFAELRRADGRWLRSWQDGRARHLALAADYAWVVECCTRLYELTGDGDRWLGRATATADTLLDLFVDESTGGLCTTGRDAEPLVVRGQELLDSSLPSANAAGAAALLRLSALTGERRHREAGERIVALVGPLLADHPLAAADLLAASSLVTEGAEVVVAGERPDLLAEVRGRWLPTSVLAFGEPDPSPLWEGRAPGAAYVCHHYACRTPATTPATLGAQLDDLERPGGPPGAPTPTEGAP
ncbi:MAG TPA: thioredoxin domain-containing protein [Acidimicrobiales bacterium]|nr:thioredoxin domain-containing protein [Acidimicrobiales bacterium]